MSRIRPVVLGIVRRGDAYLVQRLHDPDGDAFYRPIGGGIEHGETSAEALVREFREELDARVEVGPTVGTLENRFRWDGETVHELVVLREADFTDESLTARDRFDGRDDGGTRYTATWKRLDELANQPEPLYPDGLDALLRNGAGEGRGHLDGTR